MQFSISIEGDLMGWCVCFP